MQEEVTQKTIALYVKVGKGAARLTEQALQKAIQKFLEQKSKPAHGKQTMRQLMKQNAGVSNIEITDAKKNLRDSVICALDPGSRGVMVVFGGHVIAGTRAKKNKTISYDAFASVNFPALALVQGDRLVRYVPSPWPTGPVEFGRSLSPRVFLLKLTPGLSPDLIPDIFRLYDCVIVESFGVGGIPQRLMDAFAEGLGDYDKTHKVLILTTQVTYEGSDVGIYEVGKRVKNRFRFLEAHDMTIEAVVTKIMWLLAQDCDSFDQLQQRFYRQVNFDTFYH